MPQASTSLLLRRSPLADPREQLQQLRAAISPDVFQQQLQQHGLHPLRALRVEILQINLGKLCNMTCRHCHVDAGPDRREVMSLETMEHCLAAAQRSGLRTLDLTGGAPEMNPHFRELVKRARRAGLHVMDRCNLTILEAPGHEDLAPFLAEHQVEIVASLPCYLEKNTDAQRGDGAYRQSMAALRRLNQLGYGRESQPSLKLTLVYNPLGPSLPPPQLDLEQQYREHLRREEGVEFTRLFTLANMPISRFLESLLDQGRCEEYLQRLLEAFNPAAAAGVMCRQLLSVGWDGTLYDCDFNQMLELPVAPGRPRNIRDFAAADFDQRPIVVGPHCLGCTAGAGSGCSGAIDS